MQPSLNIAQTLATIFVVSLIVVSGVAMAQDQIQPTPLLPHPYQGRPVFSQDKFKQNPNAKPEEFEPLPQFTQDKFDVRSEPDFSDELRKEPERAREWSEIAVAKGIVAINSQKFDEAQKQFELALKKDPRNFLALEYLAALFERKGQYYEAVSHLVKAKHMASEKRAGVLNYHIGRLYLILKNEERAEIYLKLSLEQEGHLTATQYLLGYLRYTQGRYLEAEQFFHDAKGRALRTGAREAEKSLLQAIYYYLGEIYARLGFTRYAIVMLRQTEAGESWEVRNTAWRVHSELNESFVPSLTLGLFAQYDSNVILLPSTASLPKEYSSQGSPSLLLTAAGGIKTTPVRRWVLGADASFYFNFHPDDSLAEFDIVSINGAGWVRYWDLKYWSFDLKYEGSNALTNRRSFDTFQSLHGPSLVIHHFPNQRWDWEAGAQYRMRKFALDLESGADQRNGELYIGYLRAGIQAPNPRLRPVFGYNFEVDAANGINFRAIKHLGLIELQWHAFSNTHAQVGYTLGKVNFPDHLRKRSDVIHQFRLGVNQLFSEHWMGVADLVFGRNSSSLADFSYTRTTITGGVSYTF